jgi:hypothetical protein
MPVHGALLAAKYLGVNVRPDGFSRPYVLVMSIATALYGFLGLYFSFLVASEFSGEGWAVLATAGMWFGSSLPVYMYFNPAWSHAHSVFAAGLFLWYWQRTRRERTLLQWAVLGLISGLLLDIYYLNVALLLVPAAESIRCYWKSLRAAPRNWPSSRRLLADNAIYVLVTTAAFLPTLATRQIIYGGFLTLGYGEAGLWHWTSPALLPVLFASDHGLIAWTPIVLLGLSGILLLYRDDAECAAYLTLSLLAYWYLVASATFWDGLSSFGNRYFLSCTPALVLGLSIFFRRTQEWLKSRERAAALVGSITAALIAWNLAFIFQWGTHLVPARGPISWRQMVYNQFFVVPRRAASNVGAYFHHRGALMQQIEQEDVHQLKQAESGGASR